MQEFGGFSQGGNTDAMIPTAGLALILERATGPGRRYGGLDDDQLTGAVGRWAAMESYVCAQKLAAITELVRRRGIAALGVPERPADAAPEVPAGWAAMALGMSAQAADKLADLAVAVATRLTAAAAALETGEMDYLKAKILAEVTRPLELVKFSVVRHEAL